MGDVHAERPPEALMDPTDQWGRSASTSSQQRARAARAWRSGGVSVRILSLQQEERRDCCSRTSPEMTRRE